MPLTTHKTTYHPRKVVLARNLRKTTTPHESKLWYHLRSGRFKNLKFRRQHPIGKYIVDFCSISTGLIIELDGGQHNEQVIYDQARDKYLRTRGYTILRFWNNDIDRNLNSVLDKIFETIS
jgi:very-short-patch-repair endonuclease